MAAPLDLPPRQAAARRRSLPIEAAAALGLAILLGWQVLVPPLIGLANNGDFYRIAPQSGVYYINPGGVETQDPNAPGYVSRYYRTAAPKNPQGYYSSGVALMWLARGLNDLLRRDGLFDIRCLGAVHLGSLILALVVFLRALAPLPAGLRWLAAALACFMLSDVGYFSFFNSFYSETATLIFLVLSVAAVFWLPGRDGAASRTRHRDGFFLVCCALFLTAKPQNAVLAPFLVALWWSLRWPAARPGGNRRTALTLSVGGVLLTACSMLYLTASPFKQVNRYNHIFLGILGDDPDAATNLRTFDLGDEYAALIGTHWWSELSAAQEELRNSVADQLKTTDIIRYYWRKPERFASLFSRGAEVAFVFRPAGLGNFERSRGGPPGGLSARLAHWTAVKRLFYPHAAWSLIGVGIGLAVLWVLLGFFGGPQAAKLVRLGMCLWGMGVAQLFVVLIGGGEVELVRHLFLFNALADLSLIVLAIAVGTTICSPSRRSRWSGPRGS